MSVIVFGAVSLLSAGAALLATGRLSLAAAPLRPARPGPVFADMPRRYEFREGYLLSPIDPDDAFLPDDADRSRAYGTLSRVLGALDADLPARLSALAQRGEPFALAAAFGPDTLSVAGRAEEDRLVVTVGPAEAGRGRRVIDGPVLEALQTEAEDLRHALDLGRAAMWKEDAEGRILWANGPYLALVARLAGGEGAAVSWPVPRLFADQLDPMPESGSLRRCRLALPADDATGAHVTGDGMLWFEVSAQRTDDVVLLCAAPVDRLVAAETALRNFVQTLSKTFAHLPIGLAIFDKRRELVLFNPALLSLSTLPPEFLSRRPGLVAFLDALRDRQRMPEPKNYRTWRDEIARLEQRAEQGTYQELWTLPCGQSLRVIGRPHPDGAVAFMFEDISAEVSLTRQFRAELELYQAVLDDLPGALAVFSGEGRLVLANEGYRALWNIDPKEAVGVLSVVEATRQWQARCAPTGLWGDIRQFAAHKSDRASWSDEIVTLDGRTLVAHVAPLAGGAMSVRFMAPGVGGVLSLPAPARPPAPSTLQGIAEPAAAFRSRRAPQD